MKRNPQHQFGLRDQHGTIKQVQRNANKINEDIDGNYTRHYCQNKNLMSIDGFQNK